MSGLGSHLQTYAALREAIEAHAREAYGEEYVLQDFVMIGFVVSMSPDDIDKFEYLMATSSNAPHIIEGLIDQSNLFQEGHDEED